MLEQRQFCWRLRSFRQRQKVPMRELHRQATSPATVSPLDTSPRSPMTTSGSATEILHENTECLVDERKVSVPASVSSLLEIGPVVDKSPTTEEAERERSEDRNAGSGQSSESGAESERPSEEQGPATLEDVRIPVEAIEPGPLALAPHSES